MDVNNLLKLVVVFVQSLLPLLLSHSQQKGPVVAVVVPARVAPADLDCWCGADKCDTTAVFAVITAATDVIFTVAVLLVSFFCPQMEPTKTDVLLLSKEF